MKTTGREATRGLVEQTRLESSVQKLATEIGERNHAHQEAYMAAETFLQKSLNSYGYEVAKETYKVGINNASILIATRPGNDEIVVIGAHYDSAPGTPGADDNATGVAAGLELARLFSDREVERTVRFVFFPNEEPPYFHSDKMGSLVYARQCRERNESIVAMLSLESLGYFSEEKGSQEYPMGITGYPEVGNFIGFVSNDSSRELMESMVISFQRGTKLPVEGLAAPDLVTGVGFSDHWSFWQVGYPAVMITDTVPFRNPNYHQTTDLPETLDFARFTEVVKGLVPVVESLSRGTTPSKAR